MGRTASPLLSFKITMGMLVTGSIMSPRIFISTSIVTPGRHIQNCSIQQLFPCSLYHHFAQEAVRKTPYDPYWNVTSDRRNRAFRNGEIQNLVLRGAAAPLATR